MTTDDAAAYRRAADAIEHHAWVAENGEGVPVVSETVIALVAWLRAKGSAPSFVDAGRRALAAVDAPDDAAERAARGQAWALAEAQGEVAMLRARLAAAENDRDFWRMQMECAGPMIDAMRSLQRRFCPMMPGSVCRAGEVVAAIGAQVDALTARAVDAEAEAARRTDDAVAIGAALGREGATAGECVALIEGLRAQVARGDLASLAAREQGEGATFRAWRRGEITTAERDVALRSEGR